MSDSESDTGGQARGDRSRLASIAARHSKETIRTNGSRVQQSRLFMKQITSERPIQGQKLGPSACKLSKSGRRGWIQGFLQSLTYSNK